MSAVIAAILVLAQDPARAGAAYLDGLAALQEGRADAAAARFQEALRHLPEEDPRLQYRDREGRHSVAYHPRFQLARARRAQAEAEGAPAEDLLAEAVVHLGLSRHPDAPALAEDVRARLERARAARTAAEDAAAVRTAVRARIDALCRERRFEDALAAARGVLDPREQAGLAARVEERRREVIDGHRRGLRAALEGLADLDPVAKADALPGLLEPGRVPAAVQASPPPELAWLGRFAELVERRRAQIRGAADLPAAEAVALADALEAAAAEAPEPAGARAARAVARAVLRARLEARPAGELPALLAAAEGWSAARRGEREEDVAAWRERVGAVRAEVEARGRREAQARAALAEARAVLEDPERMSDEAALEAAAEAVGRLDEVLRGQELDGGLRAALVLEAGVLRAARGCLKGEPEEAVVRRAGPALERAWRLDAAVVEGRRGSLSPRLAALLDRVRPR